MRATLSGVFKSKGMDQEAQRPLGRQPSLAQVLNKDCLQELFARCPTRDLLQLQQTCKLFHAFVADSPTVWARRLLADFGLKLALTPTVTGRDLSSFARELYAAPGDEFLRFQGVLVNGGIDGETATYWADNLFKADRSPYCSDSSENADCLALLLDGEVPREQQYNTVRQYMQRRCRYAAALLAQLNNADDSGIDELMNLVEHWSDPHLEHFFMVLVVGMDEVSNIKRGKREEKFLSSRHKGGTPSSGIVVGCLCVCVEHHSQDWSYANML